MQKNFVVQINQWEQRSATLLLSGSCGGGACRWGPTPQCCRFGCTWAAVSVCFIHHFEQLRVKKIIRIFACVRRVAAVFLFSGASSGGGVVRQPCCLWSFAERESTLLFFPPVLFLLLLSHILNLHSIPAKCQDQWGKCAKSVLCSPCVYNDSALAGVADNMHARSTPCFIWAENMFISWKNNGDLCASVPPRVHGAFQTWIPAVRTVRHVCGDNAQPAAVSCLYRAFKRIHGVHCWLIFFRPTGN